MTRNRFALLSIILLAGCNATAQDRTPAVSLVIEATLPVTHSANTNMVELSNGAVVFGDPRDRTFLRADFARGKFDTLGHSVPLGPESKLDDAGYKLPGWVAHLAGDTLALVDFAAIRTTLWGEDGSFRKVAPLAEVAGQTPALAYDTLGFAYKADFAPFMGRAEPGTTGTRPDSIAVLRIALDGSKVDTVGHLSAPEYGDAMIGTQSQSVAKVYGPNDVFGVTGDGALWIARARTHSVDWRNPDGTWTRGKAHAYEKVPVTEKDRQLVLDRLRERGLPRDVEVKYPFAETKPAFDLGLTSVSGDVWLQYSRANDSLPQRYAVFSRSGEFQRDVEAPPQVSVTGFGRNGVVYGAQRVADGKRAMVRMKESP